MSIKIETQMGSKINGKEASSKSYIQLFEFLLFDPTYKKMSERAKVLYAFLRSKVPLFKMKQEQFDNGEGTKSYQDEEGNIFILADNTELEYLLNAGEKTIIKAKKELKEFGLLLEQRVKDKANRIYVLEPAKLAEHWVHIHEIKELRERKRELNREKSRKTQISNCKKGSYGNCKKDSYVTEEMTVKNNLSTKSNLISKNKFNLSIIESEYIRNYLSKNIDRLTDDKLQIIKELFDLQLVDEKLFVVKLADTFANSKTNFAAYLKKALTNAVNEQSVPKEKTIRKEVLPDWFDSNEVNSSEESQYEEMTTEQFEAEVAQIQEVFARGFKHVESS